MLKQFVICVKPPCNLRQIIVCFDADYRLFCVKLQRKLHGVTRQVYGNLRKYQMRAAINNMDICRRPQIFRDIEKSRQGPSYLYFRPPRRKRHPRISQKILEDIKAVGIQTNSFRVLRKRCKFVLPSLGGAGGGFHLFPKKMLKVRSPLLGRGWGRSPFSPIPQPG